MVLRSSPEQKSYPFNCAVSQPFLCVLIFIGALKTCQRRQCQGVVPFAGGETGAEGHLEEANKHFYKILKSHVLRLSRGWKWQWQWQGQWQGQGKWSCLDMETYNTINC